MATTTYYAIKVDDSRFKVAATAGGAAIDLTTAGVSMVLVVALPVDEVLEFYSRFVDGLLPAHAVPLASPYPVTIVALVAELAAKRLQLIAGTSSESMKEIGSERRRNFSATRPASLSATPESRRARTRRFGTRPATQRRATLAAGAAGASREPQGFQREPSTAPDGGGDEGRRGSGPRLTEAAQSTFESGETPYGVGWAPGSDGKGRDAAQVGRAPARRAVRRHRDTPAAGPDDLVREVRRRYPTCDPETGRGTS